MTRRHPATLTAERIDEALERWPSRFTPDEIDAAQRLARQLASIAAHDRVDTDSGWRCSCGASVSLAGLGKAHLDRLFNEHTAGKSSTTTGDPA
jgi:hypothetical protein